MFLMKSKEFHNLQRIPWKLRPNDPRILKRAKLILTATNGVFLFTMMTIPKQGGVYEKDFGAQSPELGS